MSGMTWTVTCGKFRKTFEDFQSAKAEAEFWKELKLEVAKKGVWTLLVIICGLVVVGVIVRATESGMGCPDWPLCYGQVLPPLGDQKAWLEWIHRSIAALLGFLVFGVAVVALRDHRDRRSLVLASLAAVVLVVFQAWLGRETVRLNNSGASVTAHLASAMADLGLFVLIFVAGNVRHVKLFGVTGVAFSAVKPLDLHLLLALVLVDLDRQRADARAETSLLGHLTELASLCLVE